MKRLVVLGAGTAGTMVANTLRARLPDGEWAVTAVDRDDLHRYQPGYLFLPFGTYQPRQVTRSRRRYLRRGVELVLGEVAAISPDAKRVELTDGRRLAYDVLVLATGTSPRPDQTPGMEGPLWRHAIHDFYSYEGALALAEALPSWPGGRLVVHVTDVPIKCPVAPLEFAFLADSWLRREGRRGAVDITFVTPLSGAFTRPTASQVLGSMLDDRKIAVESDFMVERVDDEAKTLVSYDGREVPFDLLVTVPLNMGADVIGAAGLGDELGYARVDRHTLQSVVHPDVFAIGDAADVPTSKAGSVAHFEVDVLVQNVLAAIGGQPLTARFDGHANCFVESGDGRALLLDFDYDAEPTTGRYPFPRWGPLPLLGESRRNHWAKLGFRWLYWNVLLPGRPLPLPARPVPLDHALTP
ncbi:MAG TPA: FAD/NAD(P)-binding oxidoreductase [Actinomycetales bacterium]|nr:FAD/NAD(P)-binding oxidoreductase [Actinomycetales bacterium]